MRNKFKSISIIILVTIFTLVLIKSNLKDEGNISKNYTVDVEIEVNKNTVNQPELSGFQLLVSNSNKGVYVYGKKLDEKPYFQQVLVKTKTAQRLFNWKATTKNPGLFIDDITKSGKDSIIIIFVTAYGTGIYESQIHVLDMNLTREIPVEDPTAAAKRLISTRVEGQEIVFVTGGREYRIKPSVGPGGIAEQLKNLEYGAVVTYRVENNNIIATVTVQTNPSTFLGEFTLEYSYEGGKFVPKVKSFNRF